MKDNVRALFDQWSLQGLDLLLEKEHSYGVKIMLKELKIRHSFDFLDIGCGNGWTVRKVSENPLCKSAWGLDVSNEMIKRAKLEASKKEYFVRTNLLKWNTRKRFDVIFSMESLYYIVPVELALKKLYELLKRGGIFLCGIDYYLENKASHSWPKKFDVKFELHSRKEWVDLFRQTGFKNVRQKNILYPKTISSEKWKQMLGTLLIKGIK